MGFRNPITSLRADQITPGTFGPGVTLPPGQLAPGNLPADVVARSLTVVDMWGRSVVIDQATGQQIAFHTGLPDEVTPGLVQVGNDGLGRGHLLLASPRTDPEPSFEDASITLVAATTQEAGKPAQVLVDGQLLVNGQAYARQRAWRHDATTNRFSLGSGVWHQLFSRTFADMPPGDYAGVMILELNADASRIAYINLSGTGVLWQSPRNDLTTQLRPVTYPFVIQNHLGGAITLDPYAQVAAGQMNFYAEGSALTLAYLGPRS